jgi:hypothetical protein
MSWSSAAFIAAVLLGVLHIIFGLIAMSSVVDEKKPLLARRLPVFFFWWPFYKDMYDKKMANLCSCGQIILPLMFAAYAISSVLK